MRPLVEDATSVTLRVYACTDSSSPFGGVLLSAPRVPQAQAPHAQRPFGTLREQAAMQQEWLHKRLDTFLPAADAHAWCGSLGRADARVQRGPRVQRDHRAGDLRGRRRTIYVFFDKCAATGAAPSHRASSGSRSAARRRAVCSRRGDRRRPPPATQAGVNRPSYGATNNGRSSRPSSKNGGRARSASIDRRCLRSPTVSRVASSKA